MSLIVFTTLLNSLSDMQPTNHKIVWNRWMVAEAMRDDDVGWLGWLVCWLVVNHQSISSLLSDRHDLGWLSNYYKAI